MDYECDIPFKGFKKEVSIQSVDSTHFFIFNSSLTLYCMSQLNAMIDLT